MNEEILARFERRSKQYSNCFSQSEIILADHFYTLLLRHAIKAR